MEFGYGKMKKLLLILLLIMGCDISDYSDMDYTVSSFGAELHIPLYKLINQRK